MPVPVSAPDTLAVGNLIVSFLQAITYPGTSTPVYAQVSLEAIDDVSDLLASGGVVCEVYGDMSTSQRKKFGGWCDEIQQWFVLSLCNMDTGAHARQMYPVYDALVVALQQHVTLGDDTSNVWETELQPNMRLFRVMRNGQWRRAYLAMLETKQEWAIPGGVIA